MYENGFHAYILDSSNFNEFNKSGVTSDVQPCFRTLYTTHSKLDSTQAHLLGGSLSLGDLIFFVAQDSPAPSRQKSIISIWWCGPAGLTGGHCLKLMCLISGLLRMPITLWKLFEDAGATLTFYPHSIVFALLSILFSIRLHFPSVPCLDFNTSFHFHWILVWLSFSSVFHPHTLLCTVCGLYFFESG